MNWPPICGLMAGGGGRGDRRGGEDTRGREARGWKEKRLQGCARVSS